MDRIAKDPTTVVCPVIDVIDDTTLEYNFRDSGGVNVGGFDWNLQVKKTYDYILDGEAFRNKLHLNTLASLPASGWLLI